MWLVEGTSNVSIFSKGPFYNREYGARPIWFDQNFIYPYDIYSFEDKTKYNHVQNIEEYRNRTRVKIKQMERFTSSKTNLSNLYDVSDDITPYERKAYVLSWFFSLNTELIW